MDNEPVALIDAKLTDSFKNRYKTFPKDSRKKISAFLLHIIKNGFDGLEGRNKFSDDVSHDDPDFVMKVRFVNEHCLWHYHIGIHEYDPESKFGDRTSMFVLHYSRMEANIVRVAHMSPHPPFELPALSMFT
ncbi:hypothetical protein [Pantoea coffeiphila]|uniref:hypothetical protein n=1 Tax=Pantoea coffeiphila TaxID=1465635 RepID=UPI001960618B|nr:hypothetical protein [Pantoea coffeiphila]MBM7346087.1 hypothetical protein [Pantoea coffeiphila]